MHGNLPTVMFGNLSIMFEYFEDIVAICITDKVGKELWMFVEKHAAARVFKVCSILSARRKRK